MENPASPTSESIRRCLSVKEVAWMLGCSERSVYRFAEQGMIPYGLKLGAMRRWDSAEIQAFIANGFCSSEADRG